MSFSPNLKPQLKSAQVNGSTATIQLKVLALRWFDGHFDEQPILPGIAMVLWAKAAFMQYYPVHIAAEMPKVKFTRIVSPGAELVLKLSVSKQLKFWFEATDGSAVCEGQFRFTPLPGTELAAGVSG